MSKSQMLLERFDELVRHTSVLTQPIEPEFIRFVQNQEVCRKKWLSSTAEVDTLRKDVSALQASKSSLEHQLMHSRLQIEKEMSKRQKAEQEAEKLGRQVALIKELLNDKNNKSYQQLLTSEDRERLAFLDSSFQQRRSGEAGQESDILSKQFDKAFDSSWSYLSDSDISYDKTTDDLNVSNLRNGKRYSKRPSAPPLEVIDSVDGGGMAPSTTLPKRLRTDSGGAHRDGAGSQQQQQLLQAEVRRRRSRRMKRSISVGDPVEVNADDSFFGIDTDVPAGALPQRSILKNPSSGESALSAESSAGQMKRWASASKLSRAHNFVCKSVITQETCIPCGKKIRFGKMALKCKDCRAFTHQECKDRVPLPCVPTGGSTPTKTVGALISDFAPLEAPCIPLLIVHCVNEVENRGFTEVGIYRIPGAEKDVKDLKERFLKSRAGVSLAKVVDIHVVCGCLKDFLRGLREPLVPTIKWNTFTDAAAEAASDPSSLKAAVCALPAANRDSLAFLVRHLQRVAAHVECKMPLPNLAKVFGPTVVGFSTSEPEPMQMITETKKQQEVMDAFLNLPESFWDNLLATGKPSIFMERAPSTPDCRPAPNYASLLGPLTGAGGRAAATPMTGSRQDGTASGKNANYGSVTKRSFFASPMLK